MRMRSLRSNAASIQPAHKVEPVVCQISLCICEAIASCCRTADSFAELGWSCSSILNSILEMKHVNDFCLEYTLEVTIHCFLPASLRKEKMWRWVAENNSLETRETRKTLCKSYLASILIYAEVSNISIGINHSFSTVRAIMLYLLGSVSYSFNTFRGSDVVYEKESSVIHLVP